MTRLWKRKAREHLLVLTIFMLFRTIWTFDERESRKLYQNGLTRGSYMEMVIGTSVDADTLRGYLSRWNDSGGDAGQDDVIYYGEGLPDVFFHSSAENSSLILKDMTRCLDDFKLVTCLKFMLVNRLDNILDYLNGYNLTKTDFSYGNGIVSFKSVPGVNDYEGKKSETFDLDEDITQKMMELFKDRSLKLNLFPGVGFDVKPVPAQSPGDFIGFKARPYLKFWSNDEGSEGRSGNKGKRKKGGFKMPNMMILPQLIMWGMMPFALANLQAMVMNAFMLNMMALNSAIFMTIRNLVFGPRGGPKIKYVNYGYRKKKRSNVPTIIVHSPAAFVKQPFHRRKKPQNHRHHHHQHHPPHPIPIQYHYHDEFPEGVESFEPEVAHHEEFRRENQVEVIGEEGQLDGKNRVRIRVREGDDGPSVKEILHRIRTIENQRFNDDQVHQSKYPESSYVNSADDTPWTVSEPIS